MRIVFQEVDSQRGAHAFAGCILTGLGEQISSEFRSGINEAGVLGQPGTNAGLIPTEIIANDDQSFGYGWLKGDRSNRGCAQITA